MPRPLPPSFVDGVIGRRRGYAAAAALVLALGVVLLGGAPASPAEPQDERIDLYVFHLDTCPHCRAARAFLADLAEEVPELVLHEYEVSSNPVAQQLFVDMTAKLGGEARAVPTIIIGGRMWVGFDDTVGDQIRAEIEARAGGETDHRSGAAGTRADGNKSRWIDVPFGGEVDVSSSLLVSTVVIAFVDGVNPCSLWVLSILLALVLHSGSRRRVALVGTSFLFVTTALYALYMVGAYSLLSYAVVPLLDRAGGRSCRRRIRLHQPS